MTRIDPRDAALWAGEMRRRVEERAQAQQRSPNPADPPPEAPTPRPAPADVLEKVPRLFGREIPMDFPILQGIPVEQESPDLVLAPPPTAPEPEPPPGPRPDVLPRLASPTARARLDADLDRQDLATALGAVATPATAVARVEGDFVTTPHPLVGVKRVGWAETAPGLLKGALAKLAEKAGSLEARATQVRDVLSQTESRHARTVVGFDMAAGSLEKAAYKAGIAKELAKLAPGDPAATLDRMTAARQQFVEVQAHAGEAERALRELAPSARETPWALQEMRALQQEAGGARWETARTEATGELLAEMDAGEGLLTETGLEAGETAAAPGAEFEFGEADLAKIGTALDPSKPPAQTNWSDHMINTVCDLGRQQGGITDEQGGRNVELARTVLAGDDSPGPKELGAADLAAVLKMSGVDLAKVDPNQLQAASHYVSKAPSLEDQQQRLRKALDTFQVLEKTGLPRFSRAQMIDELWNVAKVPADAAKKLSDADLTKKFQEVLATVNAGPGQSEIKIGKHNLKLTVGEDGTVKKATCKKPGFFSKVWSGIKKVAPIVLTVASFIPITAPYARAIQGVISMVKAIKAKSIIGIATAGAALVGAGAAIARGASTVVGTVERVANAVASGLQGVSSLRQGNILGGLASIGSAIAGGIGRGAGTTATGLQRFAKHLGEVSGRLQSVAQGVSAVQSYEAANRAVGAARQALAQAQAAGDPRAIAQAQKQLGEAERAKKAAILGGLGTAAMIGANSVGDRKPPRPGEPIERGPAATGLEAGLRAAGRALSGAGDVVRKDWESLGANAIGFASAVQSGVRPKAPQDPLQRRVDQIVGLGPQVSTLNEASNLADAALSQRQSTRAEAEANQAVKDAEAALKAARLSGDPETILAVQANLSRVRKGREGALMGYIGSSDALLQTAASIGQERRAARAFTEARDKAVEVAEQFESLTKAAAAIANRAGPGTEAGEEAAAEWNRLRGVKVAYEQALRRAKGNPERISAAVASFEAEQVRAATHLNNLGRFAPPVQYADGPAAPPGSAGQFTFVWPTAVKTVHQAAIDRALSFLPDADRAILRNQQVVADEDQSTRGAIRHAMRPSDLTVQEATDQANGYVRQQLEVAQRFEREGRHQIALLALGNAIHALQDATSPQHEGFQEWNENWKTTSPQVRRHIGGEFYDPGRNSALDAATRRAYDYFTGARRMPKNFFAPEGQK